MVQKGSARASLFRDSSGFVPDEQLDETVEFSCDGIIEWGFLQLGRDSDGFTGRDPAFDLISFPAWQSASKVRASSGVSVLVRKKDFTAIPRSQCHWPRWADMADGAHESFLDFRFIYFYCRDTALYCCQQSAIRRRSAVAARKYVLAKQSYESAHLETALDAAAHRARFR